MNKKELSITNIQYFLDIESNRSYCSGNCDDYCRCTTVSPEVTSINYQRLFEDVINGLKLSEIKQYCVYRAIRSLVKIQSISAYGVSGYYGAEVECKLEDDAEAKLNNAFDFISNNSDEKCIEYVLELEYGYVLDDLKDKDWHIIDVDITLIDPPYTQVSNEIVASYTGDETVLCKTVESRYRLIDGRHRFVAAKKYDKKEMTILTTKE
jgi:hypothetical protein